MPKKEDNTLYDLHIAHFCTTYYNNIKPDGGCFPGAFRPKKKLFMEG